MRSWTIYGDAGGDAEDSVVRRAGDFEVLCHISCSSDQDTEWKIALRQCSRFKPPTIQTDLGSLIKVASIIE